MNTLFLLENKKIKEKYNNFLIKNNVFYSYQYYLGSGDEGDAFMVSDSEIRGVIKLTTRRLEYKISKKLINDQYSNLCTVYDCSILSPNELYVIYKKFYFVNYITSDLADFALKNKDLNNFGLIGFELKKIKSQLKEFGLSDGGDVWGGNVGWDKNKLVHFDIDETVYGTYKENFLE